jgi:hypothetical protein
MEDGENISLRRDGRHPCFTAHDIPNTLQQHPSQPSARVKLKEVFFIKAAHFEKHHG